MPRKVLFMELNVHTYHDSIARYGASDGELIRAQLITDGVGW